VDPQVSRDTLANLLQEEIAALGELERLLLKERTVLESNEMAAIESVTRERQARMGALVRIEEQRRALCRLHGRSADMVGLEELLNWCDPRGSLRELMRARSQQALRCRDLNDRNGVLVAARLRHVESRLAVLTGRSNLTVTYGRTGSTGRSLGGRVLGAA
jgi:flagellar biosynthesis protein FlgN